MTTYLFRDDSYLQSVRATVTGITPDGGVVLDQTIFYAASGGQPGDIGTLISDDGTELAIANTIHPDGDKTQIVHMPVAGAALPVVGQTVTTRLDWDRRYRLMRMHTALHLLSVVFTFPVTGGWITDAEMAANPDLIKTMNVKPPMGQGRVRLIRIGDVDLQPCGGTHVTSTGEIGAVKFGKIESKGKQNRRVNLLFAD